MVRVLAGTAGVHHLGQGGTGRADGNAEAEHRGKGGNA
jgi:hypothetical protein